MSVRRVGDFDLVWGESLRWDDRRERLYFVDCAGQTLHWLDGGEPPLQTLRLPSMPTGVALTEGDEVVICLADGLTVVNPDTGSTDLLIGYPEGMHGRANDANADPAGNLVTGTLNMGPGPGAYWWFSSTRGWRHLDEGTGNANGPVVVDIDDQPTLIFGDTVAQVVYAYPYDPSVGEVGPRRVYAEYGPMGGAPDGATADATGAVWSCVLVRGKLARLTGDGIDRLVDVPASLPSDVAFGGPNLDRLYLTSIAADLGGGPQPPEASWLAVVDGITGPGAPEHRLSL